MRGAVQAWPALGGSQTFTNVTITGTLAVTGALTASSTVTGVNFITTGTTVPANGMYLPAANTIGFATNSTLGARMNASQEWGLGGAPNATARVSLYSADSASGTYSLVAYSSAGSDAFRVRGDRLVEMVVNATVGGTLGVTGAATMQADRGLLFTNQTSAAGAQTGTLTNAPAAGNPGFWLKIAIGGVSYSIPCWAG